MKPIRLLLVLLAVALLPAAPALAAWSLGEAAKPYKGTTIHVRIPIHPSTRATAPLIKEFEQATGGQAHPEVKRRIHSWPYAETRMAIVREGTQHGVRVHAKGSRFVSQRCPSCTHTVPENVQEVTIPGPVLPLQ
jgi:multiple sugar transport system substrate-binding protein